MASNSYLTKNSQYVASLVDFISDTKPYHSKLTEIVEEYQFFDEMHVHLEERNSLKGEIDSAWLYSFSSGGDGGLTTIPLKQLHAPAAPVWPLNLNAPYGSIKVGRDENTDLVGIPYVYSKKAFDQIGVADVLIERNGDRSTVEPLVEGLDWFQSHGSIQLQIKQTTDANTNFVPSWADSRDENLVATASANTRRLENDNTAPTSALRRILGMLQDIQALPGVSPTAQTLLTGLITPLLTVQDYVSLRNSAIADGVVVTPAALTGYKLIVFLQERIDMLSAGTVTLMSTILGVLDSILLPRDYEPLLNQLQADGTPFLLGYNGWIGNNGVPVGAKYVDEQLSDWTPTLYFNFYGDAALRESGKAEYSNVSSAFINITDIHTTSAAVAGDSWRVVSVDNAVAQYAVFSELTGYVGEFTIPYQGIQNFSSATISFRAEWIAQPTIDQYVTIENRNRLVFGPTAPLETWNIIKVNPLAYTRPALVSTRYGWIEDQTAVPGLVTLLDTGLPTGTIILTARVGGQYFDLTSTAEPLYTGLVQVNVPFNDGRLAFTVRSGSAYTFNAGDRFYIDIQNDPAQIVELDLGYGYDLDSYDYPGLVYNNTDVLNADFLRRINFVFDTRFTDYDLSTMNLSIDPTAISGRKWRIRAVPDLARPISTIKKNNSGPNNSVDLQDSTSGIAPDPALTATPLYSMFGDSNPAPDLNLYYATSFAVEYSDDNFNTVVSAGTVNVGDTYTNVGQGVSFTLAAGSKPFIAVVADDGLANPSVQGGDVFSFRIQNNPPILREEPIGLSSQFAPRLIMHGDGFHEAPAANWSISFSSANNWALNGLYTVAPNVGLPVSGTPVTGTLALSGVASNEGHSYEGLGVHFTIVDGTAGFGAGDSFEFTTFDRKPSFLVHGSVSGWQAEATVGERYWNGIIGFKLEKPTAQLFNVASAPVLVASPATNQWTLGSGTLSLTRIRFDAPALIYSLTPVPIGPATPVGWTIHRSDIGTVGFLDRTGTFKDQYITIDTPTDVPAASCVPLKLEITPDDFVLWNAQDVIILRPNITARLPASTDFVLVDKRTVDTLAINLDYSALDTPPSLAALAPTNIDVRFIDTYTGSAGVPIKTYSPEVDLLENWLPLSIVQRDSATSPAAFTDRATQFDVVSNGTGAVVGKLYSSSVDGNWPALFEWDSTFYSTYLPLNAAANVVVYSRNGFNDIVNVRISESAKFLVSGGALSTDYLFADPINVHIAEHTDWTIFQQLQDSIITNIDDGPFGGFLAGYDNLPYDEDTYGYDTGFPLVDHFLQAKKLASLPSLTVAQQTLLTSLLGTIGYYLDGGNLAGTELYEFLANIEAIDPPSRPAGWVEPSGSFGLPKLGMGMDITIGASGADATKPSTETSAASVLDALVVLAIDTPIEHDVFGFDFGGLDAQAERTAVIYSGELPPIPNPLVPSMTYAEFETPLAVVKDPALPTDFQARIFEINFRVTAANLASVQAMPNPKVFIWLPSWTAPQQVAVVDKIGTGKYRVSVPASTEAKLYLQPGP